MRKSELLRRDAKAALAQARQDGAGGDDDFHEVEVALALQIGPDRVAADAALQAVIDAQAATMAYQLAQAYSHREDADNMIKWLDPAHATHHGRLGRSWTDTFFHPSLHKTPPL